ncbi:MAG: cell wall-active antibiotics response protein [Bacteroidota bacterium]|nr:cell wall-active antibiotics response protein [Bacteroidota bacterium]
METINKSADVSGQRPVRKGCESNRTSRVLAGLFIVLIGVLLLARQTGVDIPRWIFSFEAILIALGLYIGIRHSFRGIAWAIPMSIGGFLLIDDVFPQYDIENFTWPLLVIGIGLFIMLRAGKKNDWKKWDQRHAFEENTGEDYLDSTVVFGGAKKNIISKNFKGGEVVTVFGGTEINLMQAELQGSVVLDLTQVFGGTKLIVPPHWKIWSKDMVAVLGGIDDKRPLMANAAAEDASKTLILKGTCMLGGIEIRSY